MSLLDLAIAAAKEAGAILRDDFHRGARGEGEHAEADVEAERAIRARLMAACPGFAFRGEETGHTPGSTSVWTVDPNDGTRDYLRGRRGSAVSIALVRDGVPVLGVVYAPTAPDDDGRLFAWEEGMSRPSTAPPPVVLTSPGAERRAKVYAERLAPWRFRPVPSIAHRLALVAAGEAVAGLGLRGPRDWDYAAGHALLLGSGLVMHDRNDRPVSYTKDGESRAGEIVGGLPDVVRDLVRREVPEPGRHAPEKVPFVTLEKGRTIRDAARLRRAQGCLLGQVAGDALGSQVEFRPPDPGVSGLVDGGTWDTIAGQPTDDSELALALARSLVAHGGFRRDAVFGAYRAWLWSGPFDVGNTTRRALEGSADPASEANGSLMRASPLGIVGRADWAREDSSLTHPNAVCGDACAAFVAAIAAGIATGDARTSYDAAVAEARTDAVRDALRRAESRPPDDYQGWVLNALQNAFHRLLRSPSLEAALLDTARAGGDTDTNAAIAGALLGAVHGRDAVPLAWRQLVLTCRPLEGAPGVRRPRPREYWPVDLLELSERLLLLC